MFVATAGIRSDAFRFSALRWYCDLGCGFHGDNTGSNPVGDANKTKDLEETVFKSWRPIAPIKKLPPVPHPSHQ